MNHIEIETQDAATKILIDIVNKKIGNISDYLASTETITMGIPNSAEDKKHSGYFRATVANVFTLKQGIGHKWMSTHEALGDIQDFIYNVANNGMPVLFEDDWNTYLSHATQC